MKKIIVICAALFVVACISSCSKTKTCTCHDGPYSNRYTVEFEYTKSLFSSEPNCTNLCSEGGYGIFGE